MGQIDLTGERFGRLLVLGRVENSPPTEKNPWGFGQWRCLCDCGNESIVRTGNLSAGTTRSCGCLAYEVQRKLKIDIRPGESAEARRRRRTLLTKYGLTQERHDEILEDQQGLCAICKRKPSDGRSLAVDHDHRCCPDRSRSCGACVRGLLCNRCNTALGLFSDSPDALGEAFMYVIGASKGPSPVKDSAS